MHKTQYPHHTTASKHFPSSPRQIPIKPPLTHPHNTSVAHPRSTPAQLSPWHFPPPPPLDGTASARQGSRCAGFAVQVCRGVEGESLDARWCVGGGRWLWCGVGLELGRWWLGVGGSCGTIGARDGRPGWKSVAVWLGDYYIRRGQGGEAQTNKSKLDRRTSREFG